jgi:predicted RNA-binding protein with PUA-like domain
MVDIEPVQRFKRPASLSAIRGHKGLQTMLLLRKGQRLSIQPVTEKEYKTIKETWG